MKTKIYFLGSLIMLCIIQIKGQNVSSVHKYMASGDNGTQEVYLFLNGNSFQAIYSDFFEGSGSKYYLKGTFQNNKAQCELICCVSEEMDGSITIMNDCVSKIFFQTNNRSILNVDDPDPPKNGKGVQLSLDNEQVVVPLSDARNIRESPTTASKIILKYDFSQELNLPVKQRAEFLEIGGYEKIGKSVGFWYKIKANGVVGWVYGG